MAKGYLKVKYQEPTPEYREQVRYDNQRMVQRGDKLVPEYDEPGKRNRDLDRFDLGK